MTHISCQVRARLLSVVYLADCLASNFLFQAPGLLLPLPGLWPLSCLIAAHTCQAMLLLLGRSPIHAHMAPSLLHPPMPPSQWALSWTIHLKCQHTLLCMHAQSPPASLFSWTTCITLSSLWSVSSMKAGYSCLLGTALSQMPRITPGSEEGIHR